jgi:copper transporter 1
MFAGSCIGVILLVMSLEFLRRLSKEYDRYILQQFKQKITLGGGGAGPAPQKSNLKLATTTAISDSADENNTNHCSTDSTNVIPSTSTIHFRPTLIQQSIRALLHMVTFAIAYFVMLLAMYYNGYFIICIFIGAYLGAFVFTWESIGVSMGYVFLLSLTVT